jgi:hypothetical protein
MRIDMQQQRIDTELGTLVIYYYQQPVVPESLVFQLRVWQVMTMPHPDELGDILQTPVPMMTTIDHMRLEPLMFATIPHLNVVVEIEALLNMQNAIARFYALQATKSITFQQALQMHDAW